jgi:hypothetical protein
VVYSHYLIVIPKTKSVRLLVRQAGNLAFLEINKMSIRLLVQQHPEIFVKEKYQNYIDRDVGDPGVSLAYYIEEIIGIDDYTYDDHLGKHTLTVDEEKACKEYYKPEIYENNNIPKNYTLVDELREKGWIK